MLANAPDLLLPGDHRTAPRVRVLMMQKDEGEMLLQWLSHYAGLFGYGSLLIFDNGSTDGLTKELLACAEARGARVYRHLTAFQDWQYKGGHMLNMIRSLDEQEPYDFALPLDCDELLAVFTAEGLSMDHDAIRDELWRLRDRRCALRIDMSLFNHPGLENWFLPDRHFHKGFLPARSIEGIDHGQHEPWSRLQPGYEVTRLTYLHLHNRPYEVAVRRAKAKMAGLVDVENPAALRRYLAQGPGHGAHLVQVLLSSMEEYDAKFGVGLQVFVPGPRGGLSFVRDGGVTRAWDADRYLAANPDVRGYDLTPLHHYLRHGFLEGRSLG